ncbi:MAG: CpsB/CapC family capsule biosynthesis tyrosine phosphatase [Polyangiaceae bacterium]
MRGFVDLHSHWVSAIDDGVRSEDAGIRLLAGLKRVGFDVVVATPHMRPGMFDNDRTSLAKAYDAMLPAVRATPHLPEVHLASEHYFDDVVFRRLVAGEGLPYPNRKAVLVEFPPTAFPMNVQRRFFDLKRVGLTPVLAHPERYQPVWKDDRCLDPLLDAGAALLLDVCALVGKYGRASQRAAEDLLEDEAYEAACSDAHRPEDADDVGRAIARLEELVGPEEVNRLLGSAPRSLALDAKPRATSPSQRS